MDRLDAHVCGAGVKVLVEAALYCLNATGHYHGVEEAVTATVSQVLFIKA